MFNWIVSFAFCCLFRHLCYRRYELWQFKEKSLLGDLTKYLTLHIFWTLWTRNWATSFCNVLFKEIISISSIEKEQNQPKSLFFYPPKYFPYISSLKALVSDLYKLQFQDDFYFTLWKKVWKRVVCPNIANVEILKRWLNYTHAILHAATFQFALGV